MILARAMAYTIALIVLSRQLCTAAPQQLVALAQQAQEYDLKAVYLYNFLQFVQWPEARRPDPDGAMVIGVVGDSPLGGALKKMQETAQKNGMKPVRIVFYGHFREGMAFDDCQLLFVCASERKHFARIVATLRDLPVLTVADTDSFVGAGGMIALTESRGKIRWIVNRGAVNRTGLRMSPQLLRIALKVVEES